MAEHKPADDATVAELKRLAEAATPGIWQWPYGGSLVSLPTGECVVDLMACSDADGAFIAACNPGVMRLVARIKADAELIRKIGPETGMMMDM